MPLINNNWRSEDQHFPPKPIPPTTQPTPPPGSELNKAVLGFHNWLACHGYYHQDRVGSAWTVEMLLAPGLCAAS